MNTLDVDRFIIEIEDRPAIWDVRCGLEGDGAWRKKRATAKHHAVATTEWFVCSQHTMPKRHAVATTEWLEVSGNLTLEILVHSTTCLKNQQELGSCLEDPNKPVYLCKFTLVEDPQLDGHTFLYRGMSGAAVVQWNHACFGVRGVSKRTGSNPVHGPSVGWASSLGATVS
ncbi:hypothetical protein E2C01_034549 [Portunus trituberculatus]|uniref:Uncharacterized protein n=1 Tax=Portunus trituberculatus TaxID=210409 RepID=A0A5B7F0W0_PORTR|nr:hypothetical protein [Portunus trituberculatus]